MSGYTSEFLFRTQIPSPFFASIRLFMDGKIKRSHYDLSSRLKEVQTKYIADQFNGLWALASKAVHPSVPESHLCTQL